MSYNYTSEYKNCMEMPSISHCRLWNRQQLWQGETFPSPSLEILNTELDKHLPGEGKASHALGQRDSLDDFENVIQALFATVIHVQHFTTVQESVSAGRWDHGYYSNHSDFLF